ncbi:hypothetical protein [Testudinibacter aquarius]|uniref:YwiC-like protein n=1 Tax=Testudinibacter aquarius TaxID=1524974 RepID=A0A4R3Y677_9PAST|nr:hypothetical protein [Testudinibacter aquarius]KAE9526281.1 hypothetical protein A1D24_02445 [Testudinibacter aquarius]TCV87092.1 hypothetical protein EDC16_1059 [Testudinibacter aquarius]TNG90981.1 hypothetical protein FHQ21_08620 [Testudinibacter aquarius]
MSDQTDNKSRIVFLALLPVMVLLASETALFYLQQHLLSFVAIFSFAVLSCQLIIQVVFTQGEICNGQRFRLVKVNLWLALYWAGLLLLGTMAAKRYIPLALLIGAALLLLITVWQQPKEDIRLQRGILLFGTVCGILGMFCYVAILLNLPLQDGLIYSPFSQLLLGLIVANWQLRLSRNRLQGFLALLPRLMLLTLLLNAIYSVGILLALHVNLLLPTISSSAFAGYFALHLVLGILLFWLILKQKMLDLRWLSLLLLLTLCLPLLLMSAYLPR